ncbi:ribonuclease P protein subunit p29 [Uranotaenia lowii]|uniref:ribonuclease P protein subunit p29 n=1 Tax=Uranotaenia lowii TaxID=190385 RepID=UPI00247AA92F|nr:ribonuclease P protein subunit p29 [Uranotaenia lowii]
METKNTECVALMESLIKPKELHRFHETKGARTTEKLIPNKKVRKQRISRPPKAKKRLTRKEITNLGLYALPEDTISYEQMLPLHRLWCGYMARYLGKDKLPEVNEAQYNNFVSDVLKVDLHGAKVSVTRSKNPSLVGAKGIVLLDTKGTFKIVSKDNRVRTIPKVECVFDVLWNNIAISIFGKHLNSRPAERSVKKIKASIECDL